MSLSLVLHWLHTHAHSHTCTCTLMHMGTLPQPHSQEARLWRNGTAIRMSPLQFCVVASCTCCLSLDARMNDPSSTLPPSGQAGPHRTPRLQGRSWRPGENSEAPGSSLMPSPGHSPQELLLDWVLWAHSLGPPCGGGGLMEPGPDNKVGDTLRLRGQALLPGSAITALANTEPPSLQGPDGYPGDAGSPGEQGDQGAKVGDTEESACPQGQLRMTDTSRSP